jgi:AcrR family transcriptional regulator
MFNSDAAAAVATHKKGRVPRALREEQILDIAEELFLEKGYEQTSIEDICRIAEVSRPTVYNLYENKAAIYLACVRRARAILERQLAEAALTTSDPYEQLLRGADAHFKILEQDPRRWQLLFGKPGLIGELADELAAERFHTVQAIAALLRQYAPDAEPARIDAYANLISGAAEQLGRWWLYNRHIPRETICRYQADFLWSGGRELRDERASQNRGSQNGRSQNGRAQNGRSADGAGAS